MRPALPSILLTAALAAAQQPESRARDGVKIEWRFRQGDAFRYRVTQLAKQEIIGSPSKVSGDASVQLVLRFDVLEADANGALLRARYEATRVKMTTPAGTAMEFDSTKPAEQRRGDSVYSVMLAAALGQEFSFRADALGRVRDLTGGDAIVERMIAVLGNHPAKGTTREALLQSFGDPALTRTLDVLFAVVPSALVRVGEAWGGAVEWPLAQFGRLRIDRKFTLRRFETVKGEGQAKADLRLAPALVVDAAGPLARQYDVETLEASGSGDLVFGLASGRAVRVSETQKILTKCVPRLPESAPKVKTEPFEQRMETATTVELLAPGEGLAPLK
jgi:hypothetical protein